MCSPKDGQDGTQATAAGATRQEDDGVFVGGRARSGGGAAATGRALVAERPRQRPAGGGGVSEEAGGEALTWLSVTGSPDYIDASGEFRAWYRRTWRGFGEFIVGRASERKPTLSGALSVGGLPSTLVYQGRGKGDG